MALNQLDRYRHVAFVDKMVRYHSDVALLSLNNPKRPYRAPICYRYDGKPAFTYSEISSNNASFLEFSTLKSTTPLVCIVKVQFESRHVALPSGCSLSTRPV